jgi:hypothetical protein
MYFNPSWSHAHSAFVVALFFWYWLRTRENRTTTQWLLLGLIAGLMLNVYYPNALALLALVPEAIANSRSALQRTQEKAASFGVVALFENLVLFCAVVLVALLPTFITKYYLYGGLLETGYIPVTLWGWTSPSLVAILFSANHGLFSWTPILLFSVAGLVLFWRKFPAVGLSIWCVLLAFYYFMAAYPDWAGISSYGNRFFVSFTIFFVLGLATLLETAASLFRSRPAATVCLNLLVAVFILWNVGLIFQWGGHLIPARGPVSWRQVAQNQLHAVPQQFTSELRSYLLRRSDTLRQIEKRDIEQLKHSGHP